MLIPSFEEVKEVADSRYELVNLIAKRARLIVAGNPPLEETDEINPVTIAMDEVLKKDIEFGDPMSDKKYAEKIAEERERKYEILRAQQETEVEGE